MRHALANNEGKNVAVFGNPTGDTRTIGSELKEIWNDCIVTVPHNESRGDRVILGVSRETISAGHIWVPLDCYINIPLAGIEFEDERRHAIGKVTIYKRRNGTIDFGLTPVSLEEQLDVELTVFFAYEIYRLGFITPASLKQKNAQRRWKDRETCMQGALCLLDHYRTLTPVAKLVISFAQTAQRSIQKTEKALDRRRSKNGFLPIDDP